jgi:hypothetical protein
MFGFLRQTIYTHASANNTTLGVLCLLNIKTKNETGTCRLFPLETREEGHIQNCCGVHSDIMCDNKRSNGKKGTLSIWDRAFRIREKMHIDERAFPLMIFFMNSDKYYDLCAHHRFERGLVRGKFDVFMPQIPVNPWICKKKQKWAIVFYLDGRMWRFDVSLTMARLSLWKEQHRKEQVFTKSNIDNQRKLWRENHILHLHVRTKSYPIVQQSRWNPSNVSRIINAAMLPTLKF